MAAASTRSQRLAGGDVEAEPIAPNRCVLLLVAVQDDYCHDDVVAAARRAAVPIAWAEAARR
jgi:hypothetical protein